MLLIGRDKHLIINGELQQWQPTTSSYVYQNIHVLNRQCRYLAQHIKVLNTTANALYGIKLHQRPDDIERQITLLLDANRITRNATICVRLMLFGSGDYRLECIESTIYAGYVLRSLHPTAMCIVANPPWPSHPTSALLETRTFANDIARQRGSHYAILADSQGAIYSEASQPLIIIKEYTATFSTTTQHCVESMLALEACRHIGLNCRFSDLTLDDIKSADELLYVTFQGVTAIANIGQHPYMNILAEHIATAMEELYQASKNKSK